MNSREECAFLLEKKPKKIKQDIWVVKIFFSDFQENWTIDLENCHKCNFKLQLVASKWQSLHSYFVKATWYQNF